VAPVFYPPSRETEGAVQQSVTRPCLTAAGWRWRSYTKWHNITVYDDVSCLTARRQWHSPATFPAIIAWHVLR